MDEFDRLRLKNKELRERLTEERRRRREAEADRQRMETLIGASPVGMLVIDAETRTVARVNEEAERIIGMPSMLGSRLERYHDLTLYRRMNGREYAVEDRPLHRTLNGGESALAEEILLVRPDGEAVMVLMNAIPIYFEDGRMESVVAAIQDMTPIEELEKLRSEFLAMVSHELRSPLATIKGSAASALGADTPYGAAESRQFFRIIEAQADRLTSLINTLLDVTMIDAGVLSVVPEPVNLAHLLDNARNAFLRGGGRQRVDLDLAPDMPLVSVDGARIAQVLSNLLSNAARHSDESSTIRISVSPERDSPFVAISVADEGIGIAAERLPHVFKKFFGSNGEDGERGATEDGLGLGLAICKGIAEAHGGRIWAESERAGHGARFTFTLPLSEDAAVGATDVEGARAESAQESGERIRILAVDDDPQILRHVRLTLSEAGYAVRGTGSADRAVDLLESERPHLALLDMMLDGTDGLTLMERIRKVSEIPVIFLSAHDRTDNKVSALKLGAYDYIAKPFEASELVARIEATLRKSGALGGKTVHALYRLGDLELDYADRRVTLAGEPVKLTATEYRMLEELSMSAGRVLTHGQLLERVWGHDYFDGTDLTRNFVGRLRRKLGDDARRPKYIFTAPGVGYRMGGGVARAADAARDRSG